MSQGGVGGYYTGPSGYGTADGTVQLQQPAGRCEPPPLASALRNCTHLDVLLD